MPKRYNFNVNYLSQVTEIMKDLPEADVYVIENYVKMPNNVNIAGANLFYVKLQTLAMLIALINNNKIGYSSYDIRKYFPLFELNVFAIQFDYFL